MENEKRLTIGKIETVVFPNEQHAEAQRMARRTQLAAQRLDYDRNATQDEKDAAWSIHEAACRDVMHWSTIADAAFAAVARGAA